MSSFKSILRRAQFPYVCLGQAVAALLLVAALGLAGCDNSPNIADEGMQDSGAENDTSTTADTVIVRLDNVASSAWEITNVKGASDLVGPAEENPSLTLTVGVRYQFDNNGGGPHPLGFQNAGGEYLLRQESDRSGNLEDSEEINFLGGDNRVAFTLTQTLADSVETYRCTVHQSMEGEVDLPN